MKFDDFSFSLRIGQNGQLHGLEYGLFLVCEDIYSIIKGIIIRIPASDADTLIYFVHSCVTVTCQPMWNEYGNGHLINTIV